MISNQIEQTNSPLSLLLFLISSFILNKCLENIETTPEQI